MCFMITNSVVRGAAEGGIEPPIGLKSMQNTTFLGAFEADFSLKMKIAPPMGLVSRSCEGLAIIWIRKVEFFFFWTAPKVGHIN